MTCRYLKENKLAAIPFDEGIGVCLLTVDTYNNKLKDVINLSQFEKVLPKRKNEKHPLLKEEERLVDILENLRDTNQISETLFDKLKPMGSKPPRLYGLAKAHKENTPLRSVLSMGNNWETSSRLAFCSRGMSYQFIHKINLRIVERH